MQYQSTLDRDGLIDLAVYKYFANVDKKNLTDVMNCFHDNAILTVQTAFTLHVGKENIGRMFADFMDAYEVITHRDFSCTVDESNGRINASFIVDLVDKEGQKTILRNTNFWRIRDDKFQEVYVYMSGANPLL